MLREESKMMQGVGILSMIFYHLFNPSFHRGYLNTILGNMGRASNPVPLYCLLSGFGLYIIFQLGKDAHRISRCLWLYFCYCFFTFLFVLAEYQLFGQQRCSFSILEVLTNVTGIKDSYYPPAWFILPYCILTITAFWIFRVIDKLNVWVALLLAYAVYVVSSRLNSFSWFTLNIFQTFYIFFPFVLGGIMAKTQIINKCHEILVKKNIWITVFLLAILLVLRYYVYSGAVISFFWAGVVILTVSLVRRMEWAGTVLLFFGKHNLNMWMIHAWICWYLFNKPIYSLGNPLLMFCAVLAISLVISMAFNVVLIPLNKLYFRNQCSKIKLFQ